MVHFKLWKEAKPWGLVKGNYLKKDYGCNLCTSVKNTYKGFMVHFKLRKEVRFSEHEKETIIKSKGCTIQNIGCICLWTLNFCISLKGLTK